MTSEPTGTTPKPGISWSVVGKKASPVPCAWFCCNWKAEIPCTLFVEVRVIEQVAEQPDPNGLVLIKPYSRQRAWVSDWSVEPHQVGKFLTTIFDEWVRNDVGCVKLQPPPPQSHSLSFVQAQDFRAAPESPPNQSSVLELP